MITAFSRSACGCFSKSVYPPTPEGEGGACSLARWILALKRALALMPRYAHLPRHARQSSFCFASRWIAMIGCGAVMLLAFGIYSRARPHFDVHLPMRPILQQPELPNGCEATSLAALLEYKGVPVNKLDLAYAYIPREDLTDTLDGRTGPNPERAYAGDPATGLGFYCFVPPLARGANRYLQEQGSPLRAYDITGVTADGLVQYLRGGDPVVVWITRDLTAPRTGQFIWTLSDTGAEYVPYVNLHCVVLIGWGRGVCVLMDPLEGIRTADQQAFLESFSGMGRRALVVH